MAAGRRRGGDAKRLKAAAVRARAKTLLDEAARFEAEGRAADEAAMEAERGRRLDEHTKFAVGGALLSMQGCDANEIATLRRLVARWAANGRTSDQKAWANAFSKFGIPVEFSLAPDLDMTSTTPPPHMDSPPTLTSAAEAPDALATRFASDTAEVPDSSLTDPVDAKPPSSAAPPTAPDASAAGDLPTSPKTSVGESLPIISTQEFLKMTYRQRVPYFNALDSVLAQLTDEDILTLYDSEQKKMRTLRQAQTAGV